MENSVTPITTGLKYGLITSLALIAFDLILYIFDMKDAAGKNPIQYLGFIILIGGLVMAIKYYKDNNEGLLSLGQAIGSGTFTAIIASLILACYTLLFLNVIDPGFLLEVREATKAAAMESGNMTEEQYEDVKGMMETFTSPTVMAISIVVMYTFIGLIISLISGLFMKTASQA